MMNVNILEGVRFYVSFACTFAFGEMKLMEGSAKIISLIARDENQHLVLTQNIINKWREGDDPDMQKIYHEEVENSRQMFENCVNEERVLGTVPVQRWFDDRFVRATPVTLRRVDCQPSYEGYWSGPTL